MKKQMTFSSNVSVIIPNYNGAHLLEKHLPAVLDMLQDSDELIIIDDKSTDDSVEWLKKFFHLRRKSGEELADLKPQKQKDFVIFSSIFLHKKKRFFIKVIQNKRNLRFAANCNRGVNLSYYPYVFLLNTDVSPSLDVLQHLLPHFADETVFAVGCCEHEKDKEGQVILGGKNELRFVRGMFIHNRAHEFSSGETAWVSGGSGLFDRQKWMQLGGFDLDYRPAYWEDVDLSFRARKKGWKILFEAQAIVDHNHESTNTDAFGKKKIADMSWRNAQKFVVKNGTLGQRLQYILWKPYWMWKRREEI